MNEANPPFATSVVATPVPVSVVTSTVVPGELASGWMEVKDPGLDRSYYYNSNTGESVWERPTAAPAYFQKLPPPPPAPVLQSTVIPIVPVTSVKATASMICSIIGTCTGTGLILGPVAIGLGVAGIREINRNPDRYKGACQAYTGITLGAITTIACIILITY